MVYRKFVSHSVLAVVASTATVPFAQRHSTQDSNNLGFRPATNATGQSAKIKSVDYPTLGNPTSAVETPDGRYVLVSVTNVGSPNFSGPDSAAGARKNVVSGIQIFRVGGDRLTSSGFIPTGSTGANGLALLPGGKTLAIGAGDAGVAFLNVREAIHGKATPVLAAQGEGAGTFDVVATPDGKYVFSSNEYGVIDQQRGNVGVIEVKADANGRVSHPLTTRHIPVGDVVPSLALSPDGRWLYVATELLPPMHSLQIAGAGNPLLSKDDCVQKKGSPPRSNGFITLIDMKRAIVLGNDDEAAIVSRVAAGCSPVRLVEAADASTVFVSARGDNAVLQFDSELLESDPEHAFQRSIPSGGEAPVGIRLFDQDRILVVANSNRFADSAGTVTFLNVATSAKSSQLQSITVGIFPRNLSRAGDGHSVYVTNYTSRSLEKVSVVF